VTIRAGGLHPPSVIFIHGLWLKPNSWDRWIELFEAAGYAGLAPGWPAEAGGANTSETIDQLAAHFKGVAGTLPRRPAIVGHAFGGLIAEALASDGVSAATVAIDPVHFRGARPVPRGPLLVMSGSRSPGPMPRSPALTSTGWHDAARTALTFVSRFLQLHATRAST
jgi:pimeloyl-ACP methyl ester carboxylesterase